jgi:hypothetical protein
MRPLISNFLSLMKASLYQSKQDPANLHEGKQDKSSQIETDITHAPRLNAFLAGLHYYMTYRWYQFLCWAEKFNYHSQPKPD